MSSLISSFDIFLFTGVPGKNGIGVSPDCWFFILNPLSLVFKQAVTAFIFADQSWYLSISRKAALQWKLS